MIECMSILIFKPIFNVGHDFKQASKRDFIYRNPGMWIPLFV